MIIFDVDNKYTESKLPDIKVESVIEPVTTIREFIMEGLDLKFDQSKHDLLKAYYEYNLEYTKYVENCNRVETFSHDDLLNTLFYEADAAPTTASTAPTTASTAPSGVSKIKTAVTTFFGKVKDFFIRMITAVRTFWSNLIKKNSAPKKEVVNVSEFNSKIESLQQMLKIAEADRDSSRTELATTKGKLDDTEKELISTKEQNARLMSNKGTDDEEVNRLNKVIEELEQKLKTQSDEYKDFLSKNSITSENDLTEDLTKEINKEKRKYQAIKKLLDTARSERDAARSERDTAATERDTAKDRVAFLEERVKALEETVATLNQTITDISAERDKIEKELNDAFKNVDKLNADAISINYAMSDLKAANENLNNQLLNIQKNIGSIIVDKRGVLTKEKLNALLRELVSFGPECKLNLPKYVNDFPARCKDLSEIFKKISVSSNNNNSSNDFFTKISNFTRIDDKADQKAQHNVISRVESFIKSIADLTKLIEINSLVKNNNGTVEIEVSKVMKRHKESEPFLDNINNILKSNQDKAVDNMSNASISTMKTTTNVNKDVSESLNAKVVNALTKLGSNYKTYFSFIMAFFASFSKVEKWSIDSGLKIRNVLDRITEVQRKYFQNIDAAAAGKEQGALSKLFGGTKSDVKVALDKSIYILNDASEKLKKAYNDSNKASTSYIDSCIDLANLLYTKINIDIVRSNILTESHPWILSIDFRRNNAQMYNNFNEADTDSTPTPENPTTPTPTTSTSTPTTPTTPATPENPIEKLLGEAKTFFSTVKANLSKAISNQTECNVKINDILKQLSKLSSGKKKTNLEKELQEYRNKLIEASNTIKQIYDGITLHSKNLNDVNNKINEALNKLPQNQYYKLNNREFAEINAKIDIAVKKREELKADYDNKLAITNDASAIYREALRRNIEATDAKAVIDREEERIAEEKYLKQKYLIV